MGEVYRARDPKLNRVTVYRTLKLLKQGGLIDELDKRQPQVLIECALVELTTGDLDRFDWPVTPAQAEELIGRMWKLY